jgi:hypothetical protein
MHLHLVLILLITACILSSTLRTLLWVIGGVLVVLGMLVNLQSPQGGLLVVLGVCVLVSTAGAACLGAIWKLVVGDVRRDFSRTARLGRPWS